jgi:hypothetical protein
MNRCASCGVEVSETIALCQHHYIPDTGWAATNRMMCDFLHRCVAPPRVPAAEREHDLPGHLQEAA